MKIHFSKTAYQNGFGSAPHKSVCGQTTEERELVKAGEIVLFDCGRPAKNGSPAQQKTTLRQITYKRGYWNPRVPSDEILTAWENQG